MRKYKHLSNAQAAKLSQIHYNQGFTLIEALVTVIVMSIGLLGVAALQNTSIKLSYDSYLRTQTSLLASDLFDRMRSNLSIDYSDQSYTSNNTNLECVGIQNSCDPQQMADYDAAIWVGRVEEVFGTGDGVFAVDVAQTVDTPDIVNAVGSFGTESYTVTFTWSSRLKDPSDLLSAENTVQQLSHTSRIKNIF